MVKYSVIIRAHNEGEELWKSIKSVCAQEISDWEIVLIDDGSQPETARIADECARVDPRVRVIHQENTGGLGAFLRGIDEAEGEYLGFLDAGDYYDSEFLVETERILLEEKEIDMVVFGLQEIFPDHKDTFYLDVRQQILTPKELFCAMERTVSFYGLALRVTRRSAFSYTDEEKAFYREIGKNGNYGDDLYLITPVLRNCQRVCVSQKPLYNYVYHSNSLSHFFPSYTWDDVWNRNQLLAYTYQTVERYGWLDEELIYNIRKHALILLAPCAKWIVRHFIRDQIVQRRLRKDAFFRNVVSRGSLRKDNISESKSRFALRVLFMRVWCC